MHRAPMAVALPPLSLCALLGVMLAGILAFVARLPIIKAPPPLPISPVLAVLRCAFVVVIVGTLRWSLNNLNHVVLCNDTGGNCMKFEGAMQFSTFTRWSWMIQGLYYITANLRSFGVVTPRFVQMLFGISLTAALMVTSVTYLVLVPGALLIPQPAHKAGAIEILLSPSGHIMHLCNTVFIVIDMVLSKQYMLLKDMPLGLYYGLSYVVFEWIFHHFTGMWHYPFMDYNAPFAGAAYAALVLVFLGYWTLGYKVTHALSPIGSIGSHKQQ